MAGDEPGDVVIQFRPVPSNVPAAARLRELLKAALRLHGFRAVSVRQVEPDPAGDKEGNRWVEDAGRSGGRS